MFNLFKDKTHILYYVIKTILNEDTLHFCTD